MYERTRGYYRSRRKREEMRGYLRTAVWVLTIVCIIIVCVTMALQTKASQVVAAEAVKPRVNALIDVINTADIAGAANAGQELIETSVLNIARAGEERMIVIDPGHGGADGGCAFGGVLEKDINREIARSVVNKLENKGYKVMLVRQGDDYVDKMDRVEAANKQNALLYVSIHQNSYKKSSISGIETWYNADDETGESRRLAQFIQQETAGAAGAVSRELVADTELCVLNKTNMPACLIETGFLSNKGERAKLCTEEYRDKVAEGIVKGIELYLK